MNSDERPILVTGATGFVGRHLIPALEATGASFICASRRHLKARDRAPEYVWRHLNMEDPSTLAPAMEGCRALVHLVHQMEGGGDYPAREAAAALSVREAAAEAGLDRIVFLGGPDPGPGGSKHLRSRLASGQLLRGGSVPAVELRAAMIIGHGSSGWDMIRSLAQRLPAMILPRWAENHSWPVDIEDAVTALLWATFAPLDESRAFDVPGPERLSHREVFERISKALGKKPPMFDVPVLTPRLSSYWITLITGANLHLTQQLVAGVVVDLDPTEELVWSQTERSAPDFDSTLRTALTDESVKGLSAARVEHLREIGERFSPHD